MRADDLLTIVYTSGSTGAPKGAMLSNRNFTHIVKNGYEVLPEMLYEPSRLLLFLPLAHCFARYIQYTAIGGHGVVGYVPGAKHLLADLRGFKPTYLLGVPRVFEKVFNAASQKAGAGLRGRIFANAYLLGVPRVFEKVFNAASQKAGAGLRGRIFANAVRHFEDWSKMESEHKHPSLAMRMKHSFYMSTVATSFRGLRGRIFANAVRHFEDWSKMESEHKHPSLAMRMKHSFYMSTVATSFRSALGPNLRYLACGGAPINTDLVHFFHPSLAMRMKHSFYMSTVATSFRSALGPNLRYLACGGAPINTDLVHFFNGMDDITFIQGYGMTETAAPMMTSSTAWTTSRSSRAMV